MKEITCTIFAAIASAIASAFGGWNNVLTTLIIFMAVDYASGLIVAGVFHKSEKTPTGTLESRAGWKGLCRKGYSLLFVLIAHRVDLVTGAGAYFRDIVCVGFAVNELISIAENAGLMGLPLPSAVTKMIHVLKMKEEEDEE